MRRQLLTTAKFASLATEQRYQYEPAVGLSSQDSGYKPAKPDAFAKYAFRYAQLPLILLVSAISWKGWWAPQFFYIESLRCLPLIWKDIMSSMFQN